MCWQSPPRSPPSQSVTRRTHNPPYRSLLSVTFYRTQCTTRTPGNGSTRRFRWSWRIFGASKECGSGTNLECKFQFCPRSVPRLFHLRSYSNFVPGQTWNTTYILRLFMVTICQKWEETAFQLYSTFVLFHLCSHFVPTRFIWKNSKYMLPGHISWHSTPTRYMRVET